MKVIILLGIYLLGMGGCLTLAAMASDIREPKYRAMVRAFFCTLALAPALVSGQCGVAVLPATLALLGGLIAGAPMELMLFVLVQQLAFFLLWLLAERVWR
jgi:hypothetical protein